MNQDLKHSYCPECNYTDEKSTIIRTSICPDCKKSSLELRKDSLWVAKEFPIDPKDIPKVVYIVYQIEIEFGQRDEGIIVYTDEEFCKEDTIKRSENGSYGGGGGYLGPQRPLTYYKVPFAEYIANGRQLHNLIKNKKTWIPNIKFEFMSKPFNIKY